MLTYTVLEIKLSDYGYEGEPIPCVDNIRSVATFVGKDSRERALKFVKDMDDEHEKSCKARRKYIKEYVDNIKLPTIEAGATKTKIDNDWIEFLLQFYCFRHQYVSRKNFKEQLVEYLYNNDCMFNSVLEHVCGIRYSPPKIITNTSSNSYVVEIKQPKPEPEKTEVDLSWMDDQVREVIMQTLSQEQLSKMNEFYQRQIKSKDLMVGAVKNFLQKTKDAMNDEKET